MKTLRQTDNLTLSETKTGRYQLTDGAKTYCFGDCWDWAERFFLELALTEKTIRENDYARIIYSEMFGYSVENKTGFRYTVSGLENCLRWFNELTRNNEINDRKFTPGLPTTWNILLHA